MKKIFFALLSLIITCSASAQNRISEHNTIAWVAGFATIQTKSKFSYYLEYQWRRADLFKNWLQGLSRVGLNYKVNNHIMVQAGYAYIETHPYGTYGLIAIPKTFKEHRTHQLLIINNNINKVQTHQRIRLEQRWVGRYNSINSTKTDRWIFTNRIRYMLRTDFPLKNQWSIGAFDEILIGFGKNVGENVFDQNRLALLLGKKINPHVKIEGGYFQQLVQLGREINNKNVFQYNNGLIVNTILNF